VLSSFCFVHKSSQVGSYREQRVDLDENLILFEQAKIVNFDTYYKSYVHRAQKKKYEFKLSFDEFMSIAKQQCYICGLKSLPDKCNGVDRYNNKIGYTLENCKSACKTCNYLKYTFDYDIFMRKVKLIVTKLYNLANGEDVSQYVEESTEESDEESDDSSSISDDYVESTNNASLNTDYDSSDDINDDYNGIVQNIC
jgi:hypothetical protein